MPISNEGTRKAILTRRQMLLTLAAGAASIAVAACGGGAAPAPTSPPAKAPEPTKAGPAAQPTAAQPAAAPAALKGFSVNVLQGSYFVAAAQELFTKQLNDWGQQNGVTVSADYLNWPDLQAKIAAAVQAGAGADCFEMWPGWCYLYENSLLEMTDVAENVRQTQGGYYDWCEKSVKAKDGKWYAVPNGQSNAAINYRISYVKKAGIDYTPGKNPFETYDEYFALGKKLKEMGKPVGQALGHSLGDPPSWCYPYMWAHGAMELAEDGKTVAINKPEFVDALKKFIQAWKDAYDTTGLSWDDSANNRGFLSDQISMTLNGSSIYETALKENKAIAEDMDHADMPKGPAGRFYELESRSFGVLKASKNAQAAKEFVKWWFEPKQYLEWLRVQNTYQLPAVKMYEKEDFWTKDPKKAAFAREAQFGRSMGYSGPPDEKAALVKSKYVVVDIFARAVDSGDAAAAVKWGEDQMKQIYK